jgi:hypothetical protein
MSDVTDTEQVLDSGFDDETKTVLLRALMGSDCPDCAQEAHRALHDSGWL